MSVRAPDVSVPLRVPESFKPSAHPLKVGEPCTMVIMGAMGDLTRRKLLPALAHLMDDGLLNSRFSVIGVARHDISEDEFRARMREAVRESEDAHELAEDVWKSFETRLGYVCGDLEEPTTYETLAQRLQEIEGDDRSRGRLFYLAIPPSTYAETVERLSQSGVAPVKPDPAARPWVRVIIEKPFGRSRKTAVELNNVVRSFFKEHQIYRIDHYLGKETVQNLLVFRFANSIFEPVWNRSHVHHVQITAAESVGVEHRAGYYEEAGVIRDMVQNHLLQLLSLTALEPPIAFRADPVRDEKVKVLNAVRPFTPENMEASALCAQYGPGVIDGKPVKGYREEPDVRPDSNVPTWAALRIMIDTWRWQGVPFWLRSGKRMPRRATEITIQFRHPPHLMFPAETGRQIAPNRLTFRVQPDEGIILCMEIKVPGIGVRISSAKMDFSYDEIHSGSRHSAYETLLLDAMVGDQTLFARSDAVEAAWAIVDPVIEAWENRPAESIPIYPAGSWEPREAEELIARDGVRWREP